MKVVLTIAGSDSSGGAGIQADLKTFEAFGLFGTSAITVLTAQNTTGVEAIAPLETSFVKQQIEAVFKDFDVAAIKIGMLFNEEIITMVGDVIRGLNIPIVLDPVAISKAGSPLLQKSATNAMASLFESATVITPNAHEAEAFFGYRHNDTTSLSQIEQSTTPVLVKHDVMVENEQKFSVDKLYFKNEVKTFKSPLIKTNNLHGTGCSFSSAIAANLALGESLEDAIATSKAFITQALKSAPNIGHGPGPINHKQGGEDVKQYA